ncbi:DUF6458 family protein [Nocardioides euryhalodurans]|uniref:DUF6458 domain-containing protein n=1 Tax=Nocardioides euryhalodurans TaxID=2518370 RepID=A0A4P7GMP6_9ACTN|nr:DUF6458 family protein [Nocardioides euryhalodurans]QBR93154.1 hypothetical protein EXE57_13395 [Nocardioides euryhalodurans]
MGIGIGILLLVIGLILLTDAISLPDAVTDVVDAQTVGWICTIVGILAIVLVMVMNQQRSRTTHVEKRRHG